MLKVILQFSGFYATICLCLYKNLCFFACKGEFQRNLLIKSFPFFQANYLQLKKCVTTSIFVFWISIDVTL